MNYYIIFAPMINQELLHPRSIVVIGGSNNVHKPGGAIVRNIKNGGFEGELHIVNPKEEEVQTWPSSWWQRGFVQTMSMCSAPRKECAPL